MPAPVNPPSLGIVAGGGPLPLRLADAARAQGRKVFILGVEGAAEPGIERYPHRWVRIAALGTLRKTLKQQQCRDVVLIGTATRPRVRDLVPDFEGFLALPGFIRRLRVGDDAVLRAVIEFIERHGFNVIGAETILTDLLAPEGVLTERRPDAAQMKDIALGIEAARELGRQDIGQGVVVSGGMILLYEDIHGTDAMLARAVSLGASVKGGLLVKVPKPVQDRRVDLPTIGARTVERAAAAGLAGIAVEAGGALISDREDTVKRANELGLFVAGFAPDFDAERGFSR